MLLNIIMSLEKVSNLSNLSMNSKLSNGINTELKRDNFKKVSNLNKILLLKREIRRAERAKQQYDKFAAFKMTCAICGHDTSLQWYHQHITSKKCKKVQALVYSDEVRDSKLQLLKDKIYFLKYGPENIQLSDNPQISEETFSALLDLKQELKNDF